MTDLESEIEEKRATLAELNDSVEKLPTRRAEWDLLEKELGDMGDQIDIEKGTVRSLEDRERALEVATLRSPPVTRSRAHNRPMSDTTLSLRRSSEGSLPPPAPSIQRPTRVPSRSRSSSGKSRKIGEDPS